MLVVADVPGSSEWYQELLGLRSGHGGEHFEMLLGADGLELMLHHREFGEHPGMTDPREGTPGRGVLLYFTTADTQAAYDRAVDMGADLVDKPHINPNAHTFEFTVRDPDGYPITISERRSDS